MAKLRLNCYLFTPLIDYDVLGHLSGYCSFDQFQSAHRSWVEAALSENSMQREECWTQSIATGSRTYVQTIKSQMAGFAFGRKLRKSAEGFELREPKPGYKAFWGVEKSDIEAKNHWHWDVKLIK